MNEHRREIMQNVFLTYLPAKKFKTSCLSAQLVTQLDAKTASYNALTPSVLHRGTVRCPDMEQLSAAMDRLYGAQVSPNCRKRGERQCIGFVGTVIDDCFAPCGERLLEPTAELMGELLLDPVTRGGRFLSEYVESEKSNLIDAIRSIRNDKRDWADRRLMQEMCAAEPYGVSRWGDEDTVKKINNQKLYQHYHALLSRSRVELFYCGSAEEERVTDAMLNALAALPRGVEAELLPMQKLAAPAEPRIITETMDVTQGKLAMGLRCGSDDVPAMILANLMFGGWSNSKLFLNVREKLSLCYYASSSYARSKGILTVSSGIESKDYDRAVEEILRQLNAVQRGDWEDWELEGAKSTMLSALNSLGDSQGALENYYLGQAATGQDESPEEMAALLRAVTPERIRAAAESVTLDTVYFLRGKEGEA
ncbi:MAG: insulinase family protein [Clostridiales bacterium]|nr:insulinase family protein [Candidatus Cacconaster stercorequi]